MRRAPGIPRIIEPILAGTPPAADVLNDDLAYVHDRGTIAPDPLVRLANPFDQELTAPVLAGICRYPLRRQPMPWESPMIQALESKRGQISDLCVRYGVARLHVFGSALREDYKPGHSDVDLLVEFGPMEPYARVDAYFGMLEELRALLKVNVDLVMVGAVKNPFIAQDIERTKQVIYAA